MKHLFALLVLGTMLCFSCNKTYNSVEATLQWQGDYAVDGCGYFLVIKGKEYKPVDENAIPDSFKSQAETAVRIDYKLSKDKVVYSCGLGMHEIAGVEVLQISEQ